MLVTTVGCLLETGETGETGMGMNVCCARQGAGSGRLGILQPEPAPPVQSVADAGSG